MNKRIVSPILCLIFAIFLPVMHQAVAQVNISPNMGLPIPVPGTTPGPAWANDINASLTAIDSHNHSPGQGVQISPTGLNINTDLTFNSNNAIDLRTTRYTPQSAPISGGSDIGELYVSGNELYYNDVTGGNMIQITNNGSVNSGAGSITGLPSGTASASYSGGTFTWQSATNTAANMDAGSYILRNSTASSKGLTLQPPAAMAANYSVTLPALPLATKIVSMDTSGNLLANTDVDNVTLQNISNTLSVKTGGISETQLGNLSVSTIKIQDAAVTKAKLDSAIYSWDSQTFTASGSLTIPANVNQVYVKMVGGGGGGGGGLNALNDGGGGGGAGAFLSEAFLTVTPAEVLTVTIGAGGAGGASGSPGTAGGNGGDTTFLRSSTVLLGARGALGGGGASGSNAGTGGSNTVAGGTGAGTAGTIVLVQAGFAGSAGGNGGGNSAAGGAGAPPSGFYQPGFTSGAGGAASLTRGGGGGGGFSYFANGGVGGTFNVTLAGAGSLGSGGGGGADTVGGANGGNGQVIVYWLGAP